MSSAVGAWAVASPLPGVLLQRGWDELLTTPSLGFYVRTVDPLFASLVLALFFAAVCYWLSVLTGNCSWVDRGWSIFPAVYAWMIAYALPVAQGTPLSSRALLMASLQTLWAMRLTYNFYRKDGYDTSTEDYRWPIIRNLLPRPAWELFKLLFIALYQMVLIWMFAALPVYAAQQHPGVPLSAVDALLGLVFVTLLALETVADQQQWNYFARKYGTEKDADESGELEAGFLSSGLFRYSRHPNFFCEFSQWWVMALFTGPATGVYLSWTLAGAFLLNLLFLGSTMVTEHITAGKYPLYAEYQKHVSMLIPFSSSFVVHDYL